MKLWQETLQSPEFKSLLSWLKVDIDRQRERVEAVDAKEDIRAYIEAEEASAHMQAAAWHGSSVQMNLSPQ